MLHKTILTSASLYEQGAVIPELLRRIACWMASENPTGTVSDITLKDQARHVSWTHLHHAARMGRVNQAACDTLTETVFAAMPKPRTGDTRSEYARRIRRELAIAHSLQAAILADEAGAPDYAAGHRAEAARMRAVLRQAVR